MSRTTRRRAVRAVAPVAGLLAAGLLVWQGSYAAFSATTTNQQDSWASGQLVLKNNGVGTTYSATTATPVINATNIVPGASTFVRCITVESSGSLAGTLKFYRGGITDTSLPANSGFNLSDAVKVQVDAATITNTTTVDPTCTAGTGTVSFPTSPAPTAILPATAISALPTSFATATTSVPVAAGTVRVAYRLTWSFPSTANDNFYQGASTKADLNWEIQ